MIDTKVQGITTLSPQPLWQFFNTICSIAHPSKHEEKLANYIVSWAKEQNLAVQTDEVGNILIKKHATLGLENTKTVVLQAHIDMVPQKNNDTIHDFTTDPITAYIDGDWVKARGTTLGADNGIGMASCLAVLAANDIKHGPIEVLLTVDEETGMTGAFGLQPNWLSGDILINTDSEQEGEVYVGCAGGIDAEFSMAIQRTNMPSDYIVKKLTIKGLKGGHSGCDIHTGRANANKLLARFLADHTNSLNLSLIDFNGGTLRNAIPREASAVVALAPNYEEKLDAIFANYTKTITTELNSIETSLTTHNQKLDVNNSDLKIFTTSTQNKFIAILNACPNGVIRMSDDIEGVVETSLNVGVVSSDDDKILIACLIRSLIDSGREQVMSSLKSIAALAETNIEFIGVYPGWKPDPNSQVMEIFRDTYEEMYGNKPKIMVIHAGLECGLFKKPYPNMDMISFGPTIKFPHSPDEKVHISSVKLYWEQLVALLDAISKKS